MEKITIEGISNKKYEFEVYDLNTKFNAVGGVYVFTKLLNSIHTPIYCGQTNDLATRFDNHHKLFCIKANGANRICVKGIDCEKERTEIETDILKKYNFACNEVLNS